MKKVMDLVWAGKPVREVLPFTAEMNEDELQAFSSALTDDDVTQLGVWATRTLNIAGIEMVLWSGGVLSMYSAATARNSRRSLFAELINNLKISETQAYRNMAVWKKAGKTLLESPDLIEMFAAEALKVLCGKQCPIEALHEAFETARLGFYVDIKTAKELRREHSRLLRKVDDNGKKLIEVSPIQPVENAVAEADQYQGRAEKPCRFTGRVVEIALNFLTDPQSVDQQAILDDFLGFANQLSEAIDRKGTLAGNIAI
ncbi:hypothetical protein TBK1r_02950 [Stieleria magnilauensis]|uniref:DUF222 domain-containing protein n=2 Tax=Stieleria magnilauensis TaxID=2527963 RepID=A0ABX5XJ30_9BACT|nr:hypothetical protein TBK1r_02950 [Planctomycetes bacterium TBK1r]